MFRVLGIMVAAQVTDIFNIILIFPIDFCFYRFLDIALYI